MIQAHAQDTHYWTQQFGSRSALLSGAVIGGAEDNTMVYYNPSALGYITTPSLSLNANLYRLENISIFNALGQEADFKSSQLAAVPLLAGGMLKTKAAKWKIGYAFFSPVNFDFKGIARIDDAFEIIEEQESPGQEALVGETGITAKLSEAVVAVGGGRALNDRLAIGLTSMFTMRSQTYLRSFSAYMFLNDAARTLVSASRLQNVAYYNLRFTVKAGVSYRISRWSLGLTLTPPSVRLMGNGTIAADVSLHNFKINGTTRQDGLASDRQSKLKSVYKSPFSVAVGVNHIGDRSSWGFALQYYSRISRYDIMRAAPAAFVRPAELYTDLESDKFLRVKAAARPVLNIALGYEYQYSQKVTLLASIRNDMSYYDEDLAEEKGIRMSISSWDIYHLAAGVNLNYERSSLTIGLLLSTGKNNAYQQEGSLGKPTEGTLLQGAITVTEANYQCFGFLLGYTFNLNR